MHDVVEGPTFQVRHRPKRTVGWISKGHDDHALTIFVEAKDLLSDSLITHRGMTAADPEIDRREHHAHRYLAEVERERFAVFGIR